jgi:parvulin-like peptidyl-prolyl isomerase
VILALGDQVVRRSDFERHVADLEARGGEALAPNVRRALLDPFLEERIVVLEARSRGLVSAGAPADQEQAAVQGLLREEVHAKVEVADDEVESYYREHLDDLREPERITLRQILVPTSNEARDVRRRLQKDPKSFDVLARTLSRAPEASAGGLMGVFSKGQLPPDLEAPAFALPVGGTSDVIETALGYHVLRVEAREAAREPSLAEARERIRAQISRRKADQAVRQFVLGLMARAKVNHEAAHSRPRTG